MQGFRDVDVGGSALNPERATKASQDTVNCINAQWREDVGAPSEDCIHGLNNWLLVQLPGDCSLMAPTGTSTSLLHRDQPLGPGPCPTYELVHHVRLGCVVGLVVVPHVLHRGQGAGVSRVWDRCKRARAALLAAGA